MNSTFQKVISRLENHPEEYLNLSGKIEIHPISWQSRLESEILEARLISYESLRNIFIKIYKSESKNSEKIVQRIKNDYEITKYLHERFSYCKDFSTAKPILCFPDLLTIITEKSDGKNLMRIIEEKAKLYPSSGVLEALTTIMSNCGRWLKLFHKFTDENERNEFYLDQMIDYVDIRLKILVNSPHIKFDNNLRKRILSYFNAQKRLVTECSNLSISGIHCDFCPENILLSGNKVTVLDFATFNKGSVYHDLTYFYHHLVPLTYKFIYRPSIISKLQNAFIQGYDKNITPSDPLFRLFMIRHILCHLVGRVNLRIYAGHKRLFNRFLYQRHTKLLERYIRG